MVIDSMQDFNEAFKRYRETNNISSQRIAVMREELKTYYSKDFNTEFKSQNQHDAPELDNYYSMLDDDSIALQYAFIKANPNPLGSKHLLDTYPADNSDYSKTHKVVHPIIRDYLERFGYYDIFMVDSQTGDIIYSVFKELDFSTSLIKGPFADSNFAEVFNAARTLTDPSQVILSDYKQYWPSYMAPASFIASPIIEEGKNVGVLIFQMPIDKVSQIMGERAGLGATGETYLVGADLLMRSDSYLDPVNHSVIASFRHPEKGKIDTVAAREAVAGKTDQKVIIDYKGNPVLSAYTSVDIGGILWGLLSEIDVAEAFVPKIEGANDDFLQSILNVMVTMIYF
jgi:methyl-accepting chemotaxis protein